MVTNKDVAGTTLAACQTSLAGLQLSAYQGPYVTGTPGSLPTIPVWGASGTFTVDDPVATDSADGFPLHHAGKVNVVPQLARIEIGNIQCLNLAGQDKDANGFYPRFGSLTLANIGIHNTKLGAVSDAAVFNYTNSITDTGTGLPKWTADIAGDNDPTGWNIDPVNGSLSSSAILAGNEFFGFNVAPGSVPNIILEISSATENEVPDVDIPGTVSATDKYYVKSTKLNETKSDSTVGPINDFKAGYIYKVDFKFNTENVLPWDQLAEFICVDVTVIIPDWVIYDKVLEPGFN